MIRFYRSKSALDQTFEALITHEIRKLNNHLPKQRRPLEQLLKDHDPTVDAVDGSTIVLKTSDLEGLARLVPREYWDRLKLPFVIVRRMELGKSIYTLAGDRIEEVTIRKVLGETKADYHQMNSDNQAFFLYRPQVTEMLSAFHSLVVIGFGVPRELADYLPSRD